MHALRHTWRLLLPSQGMLALTYWSHKVIRWLGPELLLTAFVTNLWLIDRPWERRLFIAQLAFYSVGFASSRLRTIPIIGWLATGIWYFTVLNSALLIGTLKSMCGRAAPVWQPTPRTAEQMQMQRVLMHREQTKAAVRSQRDSPAA